MSLTSELSKLSHQGVDRSNILPMAVPVENVLCTRKRLTILSIRVQQCNFEESS